MPLAWLKGLENHDCSASAEVDAVAIFQGSHGNYLISDLEELLCDEIFAMLLQKIHYSG